MTGSALGALPAMGAASPDEDLVEQRFNPGILSIAGGDWSVEEPVAMFNAEQ